MIDLKHKYALLENGTVEPLHNPDGSPRHAYQREDGKFFLGYIVDIFVNGVKGGWASRNGRIVATSDKKADLEIDPFIDQDLRRLERMCKE